MFSKRFFESGEMKGLSLPCFFLKFLGYYLFQSHLANTNDNLFTIVLRHWIKLYFDFLVYLLSYHLIVLYSKFRKFQYIQIYSRGKSEYKIRKKNLTLHIQKINRF